MAPFKWFYIWSPKYEIFHRILSQTLQDSSGIDLRPVFVPQSAFEPKVKLEDGAHFFTGNAIKIRLAVSALEKHPGEHIMISDADLLVFDSDGWLSTYLESYSQYDMVFMKEGPNSKYSNIGCMFLKSCPLVINFLKGLIHDIEEDGAHDQCQLNALLPKFVGSATNFSFPEFAQSMYVQADSDIPYRVIQCLSSLVGYENAVTEKLITVSYFFDFSPFRYLLPDTIQRNLIRFAKESDEISFLTTWEPPS